MKKKIFSQNGKNKGKEEAINKIFEYALDLGRKAFEEKMYKDFFLLNIKIKYCHNRQHKNIEKVFHFNLISIQLLFFF